MKVELKYDKDVLCKCGCRYGKHIHPGDSTWCWGSQGNEDCDCIKFVLDAKDGKK